MLWASRSGIACFFSEFSAFMPGIGDVRQTVDSRERILMGLYDNFRWQNVLYTRGILHLCACPVKVSILRSVCDRLLVILFRVNKMRFTTSFEMLWCCSGIWRQSTPVSCPIRPASACYCLPSSSSVSSGKWEILSYYTGIAKFAGHLPHRYGNSRAIWDDMDDMIWDDMIWDVGAEL